MMARWSGSRPSVAPGAVALTVVQVVLAVLAGSATAGFLPGGGIAAEYSCESEADCLATQCCGVTFGVSLCKPRPGGGEPCDPTSAHGCHPADLFCECPCLDGYLCAPGFSNADEDHEGEAEPNSSFYFCRLASGDKNGGHNVTSSDGLLADGEQ